MSSYFIYKFMILSLWHCKVLYISSNVDLSKIAEISQLPKSILFQAHSTDDWEFKRAQFLKLDIKQKSNFDTLELIFGRFQNDPAKTQFVQKVTAKLPSKGKVKRTRSELKQQKANQLIEYGFAPEQATRFIEDMEKDLGFKGKVKPESAENSLLNEIAAETELSIQDKLDTVNGTYRMLAQDYQADIADMNALIKRAIHFYFNELIEIESSKTSGQSDFDERVQRQRALSYNAQSLFRLVTLYYDMSGMKTHTHHAAALAKLIANGYSVLDKEQVSQILPS